MHIPVDTKRTFEGHLYSVGNVTVYFRVKLGMSCPILVICLAQYGNPLITLNNPAPIRGTWSFSFPKKLSLEGI